MFEKTLNSNQKVRLNPQYVAAAGKDRTGTPQILATDSQGRLIVGGIALPEWQTLDLIYWGGTTNNLKTVIYYYAAVEVARIGLTYRGGGAADNDILTGVALTIP